jgi:Mg-chelatase subunit ChlD
MTAAGSRSTPTLVTSLTNDRAAIARGLSVLQQTQAGGGTIFAPAFQMVYDMMSDTTSISAVFFVTDGVSNDPNNDGARALVIADLMRKKGAEIYAISQGTQTNPAYMQSIGATFDLNMSVVRLEPMCVLLQSTRPPACITKVQSTIRHCPPWPRRWWTARVSMFLVSKGR